MLESLSPPVRQLLLASRRFNRLQMPGSGLFGHSDLRPGEFFLLMSLRRAGQEEGLRASDLASRLGVTAGNVTQIVAALEERGLVERRPDAADRRVVRVRVTDSGSALMAETREAFERAYARLVEELGEEDCLRLASLLDRASDCLEAQAGPASSTLGADCPDHHSRR
jgi:DNA-binding MarR family transcriptional regulator